jgi:hypothetical protein
VAPMSRWIEACAWRRSGDPPPVRQIEAIEIFKAAGEVVIVSGARRRVKGLVSSVPMKNRNELC